MSSTCMTAYRGVPSGPSTTALLTIAHTVEPSPRTYRFSNRIVRCRPAMNGASISTSASTSSGCVMSASVRRSSSSSV